MTKNMSYEDIKERILSNPKQLVSIDEIKLEIWRKDFDNITIAISAIHRNPSSEYLKMSDYDAFIATTCHIRNEDITEFKQYAKELKTKLKKEFKNIKISSNLRYNFI